MTTPPPVTVGSLLRCVGEKLIFAATDADGPLEVVVPAVLWEELRLEAPDLSNADDRRDYALGMIELSAATLVPIRASDGRRIVLT